MDSKVIVTADPKGNVIVKSLKNPEFGHIRVEQVRMVIDETGFARQRKLSALIPGTIADLKGFGWEAGQEVEGRIIVKESLVPFNKQDPERDLKIAGESGIVCSVDGKPIYRKHFYSLSETASDVLQEHTNKEEIREAYATLKDSGSNAGGEDENFHL